jgi:hypothetical protein
MNHRRMSIFSPILFRSLLRLDPHGTASRSIRSSRTLAASCSANAARSFGSSGNSVGLRSLSFKLFPFCGCRIDSFQRFRPVAAPIVQIRPIDRQLAALLPNHSPRLTNPACT